MKMPQRGKMNAWIALALAQWPQNAKFRSLPFHENWAKKTDASAH